MPHEKIHRAGLFPYRVDPKTNEVEMLFMIPINEAYGGSQPQAAKGRIEEGETALQAAVREAQEEVGLFKGCIIGEVQELGVFLGRTTFYVAKVNHDALFGLPGDETADTMWMTTEQFTVRGRPLHVPVVKAAYRKICRLEGIASE